jgi:hypothetical protein
MQERGQYGTGRKEPVSRTNIGRASPKPIRSASALLAGPRSTHKETALHSSVTCDAGPREHANDALKSQVGMLAIECLHGTSETRIASPVNDDLSGPHGGRGTCTSDDENFCPRPPPLRCSQPVESALRKTAHRPPGLPPRPQQLPFWYRAGGRLSVRVPAIRFFTFQALLETMATMDSLRQRQ